VPRKRKFPERQRRRPHSRNDWSGISGCERSRRVISSRQCGRWASRFSFAILVRPGAADFGPEGRVAFAFHHVDGVGWTALLSAVDLCISRCFSGHANRGRSGVQKDGAAPSGTARRLRPRAPSGKRLDALRARAARLTSDLHKAVLVSWPANGRHGPHRRRSNHSDSMGAKLGQPYARHKRSNKGWRLTTNRLSCRVTTEQRERSTGAAGFGRVLVRGERIGWKHPWLKRTPSGRTH
jgi:hypothetical protein